MKRKILSILLTLAVVSSLGLVSAVPVVAEVATHYVAAEGGDDNNDGKTSETALATIQKAIDVASPGDTIQVAAGTYTAGFNISGKTDITITGASATNTIIKPSALIDTGVAHKYTPDMRVVVFVNNSTGITIQNLTFESTSVAPGSGDTRGADAIVFWNASSGELSNCVIKGTYTINGEQTGQGIAVDAGEDETTNLALNEVDIEGFQKNAIDILDDKQDGESSSDGGTINVTVTGGTITGAGPTDAIAQNGIVLWNRGGGEINVTVEGVTLSGFEYTGDNEACAILNYGTTNSNLTVTDSNFTENQIGVCSNSDSSVDATNNWWGNASGPVEADQEYTAYGNKITGTGDIFYNPWLLEPVEKGKKPTTYDKTLALKDGWTLISVDKTVTDDTAWKGTNDIVENNDDENNDDAADILAYRYTGTEYGYAEVLYPEYMSIIDAYYVKTNGGGGVGLKYSTSAPPAMVNKTLSAGWNLISCADKSDAYTLLSQLRSTAAGTAAITNLVSPGSYNQFTGSKSVALGVESDWNAIKDEDGKITLNPFDGYWVYMNAAKSYGVIPD